MKKLKRSLVVLSFLSITLLSTSDNIQGQSDRTSICNSNNPCYTGNQGPYIISSGRCALASKCCCLIV